MKIYCRLQGIRQFFAKKELPARCQLKNSSHTGPVSKLKINIKKIV
jgi:hypothetical protein